MLTRRNPAALLGMTGTCSETTEQGEIEPLEHTPSATGQTAGVERQGIGHDGADGSSEGGGGHGASEHMWTQLQQEGERGQAHSGVWGPGQRRWTPAKAWTWTLQG